MDTHGPNTGPPGSNAPPTTATDRLAVSLDLPAALVAATRSTGDAPRLPDPFASADAVARIGQAVALHVDTIADVLTRHCLTAVRRALDTDQSQWVLHCDVDAWDPDHRGGR